MILRFVFSRMSRKNQISYLKRKGITLGTRVKDGRKIYVYMVQDLFIEVIYKDDNTENEAEKLNILRGLNDLNNYLEKEFKTSF